MRGGRFVAGDFGEQFALPTAVELLRRKQAPKYGRTFAVISAADPLNLAGILTKGPRIPASRTVLLAVLEGRLVATRDGAETTLHEDLPRELAAEVTRALTLEGVFRERWSDMTRQDEALPER